MRRATAHAVYIADERFEVKSAGTDKSANTPLSEDLLLWADAVVVMERHHRNFIRKQYLEIYGSKRIVWLYIPDEYDFMQPELITILKQQFEDVYMRGLLF